MDPLFHIERSRIAIALFIALAPVLPSIGADVRVLEVPVELWDRPRSGRSVMAVPAIRQAVGLLSSRPDANLVIWHAPGSEPTLQAEEMKAWLMAHAIGPGRITLRSDSGTGRALRLEVSPAARQ